MAEFVSKFSKPTPCSQRLEVGLEEVSDASESPSGALAVVARVYEPDGLDEQLVELPGDKESDNKRDVLWYAQDSKFHHISGVSAPLVLTSIFWEYTFHTALFHAL